MNPKPYIIFVSDVHILDSDDDKCLKLMNLINSDEARSAKAFVLLGDIFDFYFGAKAYFRDKFQGIYLALKTLSESGVEVVFMEGNHEFGMVGDQTFSPFVPKSDFIEMQLGQKKILLSHGDLIFADKAYLRFRNVIKNNFVQWIAKVFFGGRFLDRYALWHAKKSRSKSTTRKIDHQGIISDAGQIAKKRGVDMFVFGHFHVPYDKHDDENKIHMLSMNTWVDKPNYLKISEDLVERVSV